MIADVMQKKLCNFIYGTQMQFFIHTLYFRIFKPLFRNLNTKVQHSMLFSIKKRFKIFIFQNLNNCEY